jgi:HPt (histidine-containing phosphotransfer) domain-containing protein
VKKGLERFDGDKETYFGILHAFIADTTSLLETIKKEVAEENLAAYAITVHGIKGSSRGIFAEEVGTQAAALEKAAKAGDLDFVRKNTPDFITTVETLITDIGHLLAKVEEHRPKPKKDKPDTETLTKLLESCKRYDMDGVNATMMEMERYEYETDGEIVPWLRENVDESNFTEIIEGLSYLTE